MISLERIINLRENPRVRMPILAGFFGSLYWIIDTLFTRTLSSHQMIQDAFLTTAPASGIVFRLFTLLTFVGIGYHIGTRLYSSQVKEEEYESLIQTTHDGFCVIDSKSYIVKVNKALAKILGYTEEELIKVPLIAINPSNDIRELIDKVVADNNYCSKQYETTLLQRNGSFIDVVIRTIALKNDRGRTGIFFRDITEQKHTVNTLWIKERRYHSLFENMTTGFALLDVIQDVTNDPKDFRFLKINKRFTDLTGVSPEVVGEKASQVISLLDSDSDEWINSFHYVAKTGKEKSFETYCRDGNKWFYISAYRPEVGKVAILFQDITQRKKTELKLQSERKFLKKLANTSPIGIIEVDATGNIRFANERSAEIMDISVADINGRPFNDPIWNFTLFDGSPLPQELYPFNQVKGFGKPINDIQLILEKESGQRSYLCVNATPLYDSAGEFDGMISTIEDTTERVQIELALKKNQELLVSTQAAAKIGGWEIDAKSRYISWTAETHRIFGIPVQKEFDMEFGLSFFQGDAKQTLSSALTQALEHGEQFDLELPVKIENNKFGWIRIIGEAVWNTDEIRKVKGIIQDITGRKKIEAEQYRIYTAVEQLNEALILTDAQLNIQYVNRGFKDMTGYTEESVLGENLFDVQFRDLQDENYAQILDSLKNGEAWSAQVKHARKDESIIEIDTTISPVYKENSTEKNVESLTNYIMVARDITEKVELEDQLRHAQKMDAIGRLTGSVAHDFNNILTAISGFAELLVQREDNNRSRDLSQNILNASKRAQSLTSQLLSFSRKQASEPEVIYPSEVIGKYQKILNRLLIDNISLNVGSGDLTDPIYIDRGQFEQILLNLALNAQDAMKNGGKIEIQTSRVTSSADLPASLKEPPYVCISVADEGEGIAPAIQDKIFEPFFTTKEPGKGTGLGLSTVYGIVKEYGGEIQVESQPSDGTRFNIYFPISERTKKEKITERLHNQIDLQGKHILLVDDDPAVLNYLVKVFRMKECHIEPHTRFDTALQSFKKNPSNWDILISDLVLPEKSGAELARFCKELNPDISMLLITGYPVDQLEKYSDNYGIPVLQKPFMSDKIMQEIHNILHSNKGKNLA